MSRHTLMSIVVPIFRSFIAFAAFAHEVAKKLSALRIEERQALKADLEHMNNDRQAIEALLATLHRYLGNAQQAIAQAQAENGRMAQQLRDEQERKLQSLPSAGPPLANAAR